MSLNGIYVCSRRGDTKRRAWCEYTISKTGGVLRDGLNDGSVRQPTVESVRGVRGGGGPGWTGGVGVIFSIHLQTMRAALSFRFLISLNTVPSYPSLA